MLTDIFSNISLNEITFSLGIVSLIMWVIIVWRYQTILRFQNYLYSGEVSAQLQHYGNLDPSYAVYLMKGWHSQIKVQLQKGQPETELLVRLLPMIGLLGTVDGMIDSFAQLDSDNVISSVSHGISQAMLSTLIGLLTALSGMYFTYHLKRRSQRLLSTLEHQLEHYEN